VVDNAILLRRVIDEIWNAGNVELADELFASGYVNHGGLIPDLVRGPEGIKFSVAFYRAAFPALHVAVDEVRVDQDAVTLRWTAGSLTGVTSSQVVDGQIHESWTSWDAALVLQRLGVVEALHEETS